MKKYYLLASVGVLFLVPIFWNVRVGESTLFTATIQEIVMNGKYGGIWAPIGLLTTLIPLVMSGVLFALSLRAKD